MNYKERLNKLYEKVIKENDVTIDLSKRSVGEIKDILQMLKADNIWYSLTGHKLTVDEDEIRGNFDLKQQKFIWG